MVVDGVNSDLLAPPYGVNSDLLAPHCGVNSELLVPHCVVNSDLLAPHCVVNIDHLNYFPADKHFFLDKIISKWFYLERKDIDIWLKQDPHL